VLSALFIYLLSSTAAAQPADLWARIGIELGALQEDHPRVASERNWYVRNPDYLARVSRRAEPYLYHVVETVSKRGMPMELALLPIMESAYDPFAYSHGRAAGMWQIIPGTARYLDLELDWWYDGRRDVQASTMAALDYLAELNATFDGDWLLSLAAYNGGPRRVERAREANRKRGRPTDFWSLDLPRETRNYVPRLLALSSVVAEADQFGIQLATIADAPHFDIVHIGSQMDLAQAADLAALDLDELYRLNAGFNRWATPPEGPHELLIPVEATERFTAALNTLDRSQRVQWTRYTIRRGDSLSTIARRYGTEAAVLREINGLRNNTIIAGKALMIPVASAPASHYSLSAEQRLAHKQSSGSGRRREHVVQPGDSFWLIANRYGVSARKVAEWNGLATRDRIHPGQTLVIWTPQAVTLQNAAAGPAINSRAPVTRKLGYRVRRGDSLARIAGRFNVSVADIISWNDRLSGEKYIHPGQVITLYVDITET
jgi:membrane-bound lytic murein transglycosylase D